MINNQSYTNIRVVLDDLLQHELLQDLTLEQLVGYVRRFVGLFNMPQMYVDKIAEVKIEDYRGKLPCDLVSVIQVRDKHSNICLRYMTNNFPLYKPHNIEDQAFKTQGDYIFTTFKKGVVDIAYLSMPVDSEGYPLILDNEVYKQTLELYVKLDRFTRYFDTGRLPINVLQNTQQEYSWYAGRLNSELNMPSISELESLSNAHNQLLPKTNEFKKGFANTGAREEYYTH